MSLVDQKQAHQNRDRTIERQIRLKRVLEQSGEIKDRANKLKQEPYGANWLYRSLSNFRKVYPAELLAALSELATDKESNTAVPPSAENQREPIEPLQGLGIFTADIREVLIGKILQPLKKLEEYAEDQDSTPSLATYCRWADSLEKQFEHAAYLVKEGQAFFSSGNLERLKSIPLSEKSARLVRSVQWDCDKATVKGRGT